jgi:ParB family chromosome partitioning protein
MVRRRRLAACEHLGWTRIPAQVIDFDDALAAEHDENEMRKDFSPSEAVAIGVMIEEREREKAKVRQKEHGETAPGQQKNTGENFTQVFNAKSRDIAAAAVGWSGPTYDKAKAVVHAARQDPDAYTDLVEAMDRTGKVSAAYRQLPASLRL